MIAGGRDRARGRVSKCRQDIIVELSERVKDTV